MGRRARLLIGLALAAWIGRWVLLEAAMLLGKRYGRPAPDPKDSARPPGWMPGPFD